MNLELQMFDCPRTSPCTLVRHMFCRLDLQAHHGDWFGGKAVGLAVMNFGKLKANVYVTHVGSRAALIISNSVSFAY